MLPQNDWQRTRKKRGKNKLNGKEKLAENRRTSELKEWGCDAQEVWRHFKCRHMSLPENWKIWSPQLKYPMEAVQDSSGL